ncbi:MAG: GIY-YIG nuclease family protein [Patescibacteria group bacterium]
MHQKYYLYILRSKLDKNLYIGVTTNLYKRVQEHNFGNQQSTKNRGNFELIYYEVFFNKLDVYLREKYFKTGWGRKHLRHALSNTLSTLRT